MLNDIFRQTIEEEGLIAKKDRILLGVSGGPDSLCLLRLLADLRCQYRLKLAAAHFNHGLRAEADEEEKFVKEACRELDVPCIAEKKYVKDFFYGDSLEQTARNLRYDFFLKCARHLRMKKLALAHHKDDLIETVLMRLIRGSGLRGLRGFLPLSRYKSLTVIRPLIAARKEDILAWLDKQGIKYCLDQSNFEEVFFRNKVRLKLLPVLQELNPTVADNLYNAARAVALDYDFIYGFCRKKFEALRKSLSGRKVSLELKGLKDLPDAVLGHVVRIAIEEAKGNVRGIEVRHLNEIRDLILNRPVGSLVDLPGATVGKEEKTLWICSQSRA